METALLREGMNSTTLQSRPATSNRFFDVAAIKAAADPIDILVNVAGIPENCLDGREGPCFRCGGNTRLRLIDKKTGAMHCSHCFSSKNGDFIAVTQWARDLDFQSTLAEIANHLGIQPSERRKRKQRPEAPRDPAEHLEFCDWNDQLAGLFCLKKKPIRVEALRKIDARMAVYRKSHKTIAIPVINRGKTTGWLLYAVSGGNLPCWTAGNKQPEMKKVLLTSGSKAGLIGHWPDGFTRAVKTEGPSDLLALLSLPDLPSNLAVFCNANGAKERPSKFESELKTRLQGMPVDVVHDCDQPGQEGALYIGEHHQKRPGWCPVLAGFAGQVRNVVLPYSIEPTHGKDLRDWIADGNAWNDFEQLAEASEPFEPEAEIPPEIEEAPDDPHRLARVNLKRYEAEHNGRIVFWRDEWHKYKNGVYRSLNRSELKAKLTASIRQEFERDWLEADAADREGPIRKVTSSLVNNVYGATQSLVTISSNILQPCWLPDRSRRRYISMANCLLDLDALFADKDEPEVLLPHSPNWFSQTQLEYGFDPAAHSELWETTVERTCDGDPEKIQLLQEWAGYLLSPEAEEQAFLMLEGDGGTGKSTIFAALEAMLGSANVSHLSLENMDEDFALSSTLGKSANIAGDVGKIKGNEEAILKRYTGGETLRMRRMYIPPIDARPTAKLMFACNERPSFRDKSEGLWRRMILIPLNRRVTTSEVVKGMSNPLFWRNEAPGIFNWAIQGLDRLGQQGGFSRCEAHQSALQEFRREANPSGEFFQEFIEAAPESSISASQLRKLYLHWTKAENLHPLGPGQFGKELRRFQPTAKRVRRRNGRNLSWWYEGIRFSVDSIEGLPVDSGDLFS